MSVTKVMIKEKQIVYILGLSRNLWIIVLAA